MRRHTFGLGVFLLTTPFVLSSCVVPDFDVPSEYGSPTIRTIVQRITCELVDMVKDGRDGQPVYDRRISLLAGNYLVSMNLELKVTDTGELAPNFNFPAVGNMFGLNVGFKASKSRIHDFNRKMRFSMPELYSRWESAYEEGKTDFGACPDEKKTDLDGELGIEKLVSLQFSAPGADVSEGNKGEFGGIITFIVTKNINSAGATWTLTDFIGPGNFAKLETKSTNRITFAFAASEVADVKPTPSDFREADDFLNILLLKDNRGDPR